MKTILGKKIIGLMLLAGVCSQAWAGEKEIRQSFATNYPGMKVEHIKKTPYSGLYEAVIGDQLVYTDEQGLYIFDGNVVDVKKRRNLSEERRRQLFALDFNKLPFELALKQVRGNGKRVIAQFTDPNCGFCRRLEKEFAKMNDITVYSFIIPLQPGSDEVTRNILCSKDPLKTWNDLMLNGVAPAKATCETQTEKVMELAKKSRVSATPSIVFSDGIINAGYMPAEELEKHLTTGDKK